MNLKEELFESKRYNKQEQVQLTGLKFSDGTIDFWTVDKNGIPSEDLTYPIETKVGNPSMEVAVSKSADVEFLQENGLIITEPNSSFESGNDTYYVYGLTEKGVAAAEQLPKAMERNIDHFYTVIEDGKESTTEIIYAENEKELSEKYPELEENQYVVGVKDAWDQGYGLPKLEIDHDYSLRDLIEDVESGFDYEKDRYEKYADRIDHSLSNMSIETLRYLDLMNQKRGFTEKIHTSEKIDLNMYDTLVIEMHNYSGSITDEQKNELESIVSLTNEKELSDGVSRRLDRIQDMELAQGYAAGNENVEIENSQEIGNQ
ncbi:hypothetical protein [Enterococcus termitis]|uniref:Uncharacterized protein n=1 Tax=Enterococcus termitis TaxID=332950 RepID=A0A1E5H1H2_9ENTE|nr:hypothetical protein [Enterococcus termitis]OEG18682.1 hypothetical protein BCR25_15905 [Enterococcus termitis]